MDAPIAYPQDYKSTNGTIIWLLAKWEGEYIGVWEGREVSNAKKVRWYVSQWDSEGKNITTEHLNIG